MRGSAAAAPLAALGLWAVVVAMPILCGAGAMLESDPGAADVASPRAPAAILAASLLWALGVAGAAALLGHAPGRLLASIAAPRRRAVVATLTLAPIAVPVYAIFYAWWQAWPPDAPLHAWAIETGRVGLLRRATLGLALVAWSWPIVAWCVAATVPPGDAAGEERLLADGAGRLRIALDRWRRDAGGLVAGATIVFLLVFAETTAFDLAQVFSFGNELRARAALGATPGAVLRSAAPGIAIGAAGLLLAAGLLAARRGEAMPRPPRGRTLDAWLLGATWIVACGLPAWLLLRLALAPGRIATFLELDGRSLLGSLLAAGMVGAVAALLALGHALAPRGAGGIRGGLAVVVVGSWLLLAVLPGAAVAIMVESAWKGGGPLAASVPAFHATLTSVLDRGPLILVIGHLARFGAVAVLLGGRAASARPCLLVDVERIDGAVGLGDRLRAAGPAPLVAAIAAALVTAVLALGEIPVTARLQPPATDPIATRLLNAMHYQRPEPVLVAIALLLGGALASAALLVLLGGLGRAPRRLLPLLLAALLVAGCGEPDDDSAPLGTRDVFGTTGSSLGQFAYPRAIDVDVERGRVFVVDKTARVQRFDLEGRPELSWRMPDFENGKPTGITVAPDGRVFVADTHYHRIVVFDDAGAELLRFGGYGEEPGTFIYPTDVALGPEGRLYVAEYGGNDRVQVFTPEGAFLFAFGTFGDGPDGEEPLLNRPQALAWDLAREELYIADACHHRIVVVDPRGRVLRAFGGPGLAPGSMHYPYGLILLPDGSLLACEFGNHRLQRFDREGRTLEVLGRLGAAEGELRYPWSVAATRDRVFVLDSGNDRVQAIRLP